MANKQIVVKLGADTSGVTKAMNTVKSSTKNAVDGVGKSFGGLDGKAEKSGNGISSTFKNVGVTIAGALAVDKLIDFGKFALESTASAKAMSAQFEQVFGNQGTNAQKMIDDMAGTFGMLPNRIKPSFTATTSMFKGLGLSTEDAMKQATSAVTMASDAAAFYDKSYEDANSSLNSFIKGNYEGGESIGLFANETQMASWASKELGVDWENLDEAGKQIARLEYAKVMQEAAGATGQASRESEGWENQLGNMKRAFTDFASVVGVPILEVMISGIQFLIPILETAGEKLKGFGDWFNDLSDEVSNSTAWTTLKEVLEPVGQAFTDIKDSLSETTFLTDAGEAFNQIKDAVLEIDFVKLKDDFVGFLDKWTPFVAGLAGFIGTFALVGGAVTLFGTIMTISAGIAGFLSLAYTAVGLALLSINWPLVLVALAIGALIAIGVALWENLDTIMAKLGEMKDKFMTDWEELKNIVGDAMTTLKDSALEDFDELKNLGTEAVTTLKTAAIEDFEELKTIGSEAFETLKTAAVSDANELKTGATGIFETLRTAAISDFTELKTGAINKFNEMKTTAMTKFNEMKTSIVSKALEMKNNAVNKFQELKTGATEKISGAVSSVRTKFNEVISAVSTPINKAKNAVKTAIDKIKGFMDFKWSLPKLKMPHFSLSGKFSLKDMTVPKLGVSWHANGGIVKGTQGGTVVGVGENGGSEAIVPLSNKSRMKPFAAAVAGMMPDKGSDNSGGGGDTIITGNTFHVREEADIKKVAVELQKLDKKNRRAKGKGGD